MNYLTNGYHLFLLPIVLWCMLLLLFKVLKPYTKNLDSVFLRYLAITNIAFSFTGLSIGILTGWSASPVVGVVIPALLTFYGGMVSYAFIFKNNNMNKNDGIIMAFSLISISFFLILGADYGTSIRIREQSKTYSFELDKKRNYETFLHNLKNSNTQQNQSVAPKVGNEKLEFEREKPQ